MQIKPLQLVGQAADFKFETKFELLPVIWQSLPKVSPEDNRRWYLQNQWQRSWGSAVTQVGLLDRQAQIQGVSKSAAVAADCHLLTWGKCATTGAIYWLSLRVKIVLMLCKFWAVTSHWRQIFFYSAMKFSMELARTCYWPKLFSLLPWSFIDLWVKEGHRNKSTCSKLNPVQSSRSKLTTCPRKGRLLRFQSNRTAT